MGWAARIKIFKKSKQLSLKFFIPQNCFFKHESHGYHFSLAETNINHRFFPVVVIHHSRKAILNHPLEACMNNYMQICGLNITYIHCCRERESSSSNHKSVGQRHLRFFGWIMLYFGLNSSCCISSRKKKQYVWDLWRSASVLFWNHIKNGEI